MDIVSDIEEFANSDNDHSDIDFADVIDRVGVSMNQQATNKDRHHHLTCCFQTSVLYNTR